MDPTPNTAFASQRWQGCDTSTKPYRHQCTRHQIQRLRVSDGRVAVLQPNPIDRNGPVTKHSVCQSVLAVGETSATTWLLKAHSPAAVCVVVVVAQVAQESNVVVMQRRFALRLTVRATTVTELYQLRHRAYNTDFRDRISNQINLCYSSIYKA